MSTIPVKKPSITTIGDNEPDPWWWTSMRCKCFGEQIWGYADTPGIPWINTLPYKCWKDLLPEAGGSISEAMDRIYGYSNGLEIEVFGSGIAEVDIVGDIT
jgi:hypothetical protein